MKKEVRREKGEVIRKAPPSVAYGVLRDLPKCGTFAALRHRIWGGKKGLRKSI
jgi:hypothetical protein